MVEHGQEGWTLDDYDWDPATGLATLVYERKLPGRELETVTVVKQQPALPSHVGWK